MAHILRENLREGKKLQDVACPRGFQEIVKAPTRDRYLLDLLLTDCDFITADVVLGFSNHFGIKVTIKFVLPEQEVVKGFCFNYKTANWDAPNKDLHEVKWSMLLGGLNVDDAGRPSSVSS